MSTVTVDRFVVALKDTVLNPTVDGKHSVFQVSGNSESYVVNSNI